MKEVEADCLLDLHRAPFRAFFSDIPDPDIAAAPEIVHVLLLRRRAAAETCGSSHDPAKDEVLRQLGIAKGGGAAFELDHILVSIERQHVESIDQQRVEGWRNGCVRHDIGERGP